MIGLHPAISRPDSRKTHLFDQQAYMHATRLCFEIAVFQAVQTVLGVQPRGCLFHFTQNIYRHIQSLGLQVAYNTNTPQGVRKWLCSLIALYVPLVPPVHLQGVTQAPQLYTTDDCDARLHSEYIHWYKYIALFDSQTWNVYGMSDIMINICESEGFHYALNQAVLIRHPSAYIVWYRSCRIY